MHLLLGTWLKYSFLKILYNFQPKKALIGISLGVPINYTDQFDDYFDEEEEDLAHPGDMSAGRLTGSGGKKDFH